MNVRTAMLEFNEYTKEEQIGILANNLPTIEIMIAFIELYGSTLNYFDIIESLEMWKTKLYVVDNELKESKEIKKMELMEVLTMETMSSKKIDCDNTDGFEKLGTKRLMMTANFSMRKKLKTSIDNQADPIKDNAVEATKDHGKKLVLDESHKKELRWFSAR
eukprot:CAMPEP_0170901980 /NCGR_PEP_ID=MMETSP0734-20130129/48786_1 /TAXON_ID=186038 /ORGANISM="Fragilariopsis kerguelensis, Strain L26-C5" /LENGTH=161 /DNA_ID=CAMNT_0011296663 /DNA_START=206 /DNA_END=688 /DNA_ORIENTATION=-